GASSRGDEIERARHQRHGLRQVDDVDAVARAEDVRLHARVPAVGLVAEVSAGLDQLLHRDGRNRHRYFLSGYASGKLGPCGSPAAAPVCALSMWICSREKPVSAAHVAMGPGEIQSLFRIWACDEAGGIHG